MKARYLIAPVILGCLFWYIAWTLGVAVWRFVR